MIPSSARDLTELASASLLLSDRPHRKNVNKMIVLAAPGAVATLQLEFTRASDTPPTPPDLGDEATTAGTQLASCRDHPRADI